MVSMTQKEEKMGNEKPTLGSYYQEIYSNEVIRNCIFKEYKQPTNNEMN
jgi:hypothetical protein